MTQAIDLRWLWKAQNKTQQDMATRSVGGSATMMDFSR
jgi:hypothetical protein